MVDVQNSCKKLYSKFNWGKNYELLLDVCKELEINMKQLTTFSTTRFANSIKNVTINVRQDFPAVVKCLHDIKNNFGNSQNEADRKKAMDAETLISAIENKQFALLLSGISGDFHYFQDSVVLNLPKCP